jgi:hypothetical protein
MIDCSTWTNENTLTLITIIGAVIGGFFALKQWRQRIKLQRSEFVKQLIEKLRFDEDMATTMYKIDYNEKSWYNNDFHGGEFEFAIDKLLSYLSYICYLNKTKNISKEEFKFLQYEVIRTCKSFDVQSYLWNLYHFSRCNNSKCLFEHLISFGIENKIFNKDFIQNNCKIYKKRINF